MTKKLFRYRTSRVLGWVHLVVCLVALSAMPGKADDVLTTDEVVAELLELTPKVTPFTVTVDRDAKWIIFREVLESKDRSVPTRIGELRARLDRMDPTRMHYATLEPGLFRIVVQGKPIAGRANFFCRENEKCIARELREEGAPVGLTDGDERTFGIDIFNDVTFNELHRFADLVRHLIVVSNPK